MTNVRVLEHNIYATNSRGANFRAISIAGSWRLCKENPKKPGYEWHFVNNVEYRNGQEAIQECELY